MRKRSKKCKKNLNCKNTPPPPPSSANVATKSPNISPPPKLPKVKPSPRKLPPPPKKTTKVLKRKGHELYEKAPEDVIKFKKQNKSLGKPNQVAGKKK